MRALSRTWRLIVVLAGLTVLASTIVARHAAGRGSELDAAYTEQISRNHDFKFGANPFAPSNAASTTGTFIPGKMFVASRRFGTCPTQRFRNQNRQH